MDDIFGVRVKEVVVGILRGVPKATCQFGEFKGCTDRRGSDSWAVVMMLATVGVSISLIL
jgi:hypothetical protein